MRAALALLLLLGGAGAARGQPATATTWAGSYHCAQGETGLALHLTPGADESLTGVFHFFPLRSGEGAEGCFEVFGPRPRPDGTIALAAGAWLLRPPGFVTVDLVGRLGEDGQRLEGRVFGPGCGAFALAAGAPAPALPPACRPGQAVPRSIGW